MIRRYIWTISSTISSFFQCYCPFLNCTKMIGITGNTATRFKLLIKLRPLSRARTVNVTPVLLSADFLVGAGSGWDAPKYNGASPRSRGCPIIFLLLIGIPFIRARILRPLITYAWESVRPTQVKITWYIATSVKNYACTKPSVQAPL
jgi:hypothetical protein